MSQEQAETGPVEAWLAEVAKKSRQPLPVVQKVLAMHRVRPAMAPPRPHRLLVTSVVFEGVRPAADSPLEPDAGEPFSFSWDLGPGLWCLASLGRNEAGKSSVLEIVLWCLRGRSGLQRDVRHWLRLVRVSFEVDGEPLLVDMTVRAGSPHGHVVSTQSGTVLVGFDGLADFEESMDAFMMERLGLEPLRTAQAAPGGPMSLPSRASCHGRRMLAPSTSAGPVWAPCLATTPGTGCPRGCSNCFSALRGHRRKLKPPSH